VIVNANKKADSKAATFIIFETLIAISSVGKLLGVLTVRGWNSSAAHLARTCMCCAGCVMAMQTIEKLTAREIAAGFNIARLAEG
jgi:hypothetical protein